MEYCVKKHFILVHGFGHGAWCWYRLVSLLKLAGQRVTALDLGACGVNTNTKRLNQIASISDYLQPLMDLLASLPPAEKVILVGHSYGGFMISLAMESFPHKILVAVFVTAYMPNHKDPPVTLMQQFFKRNSIDFFMDCRFIYDQENQPVSATFGPDFIATKVYQHCQPEDLELAKMLMRADGFFLEDMAKESLLTEEKYGSVDRVYIVCEEDEVMKEEFQRWLIENSPPKEVKSVVGADHMVMLSKPKELCLCLLQITEKYQ
ncbi:hypothetical protein F0562_003898 [Nyssa sinensis]|uniref:AB hydrolase-1 domain-containing protein n=1 Tax=Nyssa sinensis TaxID=561372 RepID=A0A5J5BWK8_9ASTE|nr:hypothetical protein F0562_003898 [Nyssa sinensis]